MLGSQTIRTYMYKPYSILFVYYYELYIVLDIRIFLSCYIILFYLVYLGTTLCAAKPYLFIELKWCLSV